MALLDQLNKQGKDIVVAHVNYKHRDTADRDEKIVKEYCKKYDIPVRVLYPVHEKGNFQAWARDVRFVSEIELPPILLLPCRPPQTSPHANSPEMTLPLLSKTCVCLSM